MRSGLLLSLELAGGQRTPRARPIAFSSPSRSARPSDQPERFEFEQHLMRAMIRIHRFGVEPELRLFGCLVGVRDPGELLDLALARELVEPLAVAPLAFLQAGRDMDFDEGAMCLDHLAHCRPRRRIGSDRGAERNTAILGDLARDIADPADIDVAMLLRKAKLRRQVLAHDIAIEQ